MTTIAKIIKIIFFISSCISMCFSLASYATPQESTNYNHDPFEPYNRKIFTVNDTLDKNLLKPIAKNYKEVIPQKIRQSITNVYRNADTTVIIADDILQGDFVNTMADSWRLFINSTFGIFGLYDVASKMNVPIPYHYNDFGLTLAHWGFRKSHYFIIPLLGPSTLRDTVGIAVDYYAFNPISYTRPIMTVRAPLLGLYYLNSRANLLEYENVFQVAALDPYIFQRNAYMQQRNHLIEKMQRDIQAEYDNLHKPQKNYLLHSSEHKRPSHRKK